MTDTVTTPTTATEPQQTALTRVLNWPATEPTQTVFPAQVLDLPCGHIEGDVHDDECAYWRGVARGDYPAPEAYMQTTPVTLPPHAAGLVPVVDPALRSAA